MARLLRRRLICFYCGCRSPQTLTSGLRQWKCESCEAVNHLDDNGEITDPPASEDTSSNKRYAQRIQRPKSPAFSAADQTIFCQTCLKNQYLVTQNLADYLPVPNDPRYTEFEAKYPEYRKNLEERYPQVCEDCEPRIRERIRETGYAAKTDYLRRMMEKNRSPPNTRSRWQQKDVFASMGATGLVTALAGQLLWNGLGALTVFDHGLSSSDDTTSLASCISLVGATRKAELGCDVSAYPVATITMIIGLLCIWWNPTMQRRPLEQAVGLAEFYRLQLILNFARLVAWYVLGRQTEFHLDQSVVRAIHATMVAFNVVVSLVSYRTAHIDRKPRVSFHETAQPLIARNQTGTSTNGGQPGPSPPNSQFSVSSHRTVDFPISNLASPPRPAAPPIYRPLTPPPDDDSDAMDIDTPQKNHQISPSVVIQTPTPQRVEPSPFHGRLPPPPVSQEHQLRNPPNRPAFRKASFVQQQSFANNFKPGIPRVMDDNTASPDSPRQMKMEPGRWWSSAANQLTGLEGLLETFSTSDEPPELRRNPDYKPQSSHSTTALPALGVSLFRILNTVLVLLSVSIWPLAHYFPLLAPFLRFTALAIAGGTAGLRLLSKLNPALPFWRFSDILVLGIELLISMGLCYLMRQATLAGESIDKALGNFPLGYLGFMAAQEVRALLMEVRWRSDGVGKKDDDDGRGKASEEARARRPLPIERKLSTEQSSQHAEVNGSVATKEVDQSLAPRVTRLEAQQAQSPGTSKGLAGLSLGFGDAAGGSGSARARRSDLRGRRVDPWKVGGL